jgi:hypothetical protein
MLLEKCEKFTRIILNPYPLCVVDVREIIDYLIQRVITITLVPDDRGRFTKGNRGPASLVEEQAALIRKSIRFHFGSPNQRVCPNTNGISLHDRPSVGQVHYTGQVGPGQIELAARGCSDAAMTANATGAIYAIFFARARRDTGSFCSTIFGFSFSVMACNTFLEANGSERFRIILIWISSRSKLFVLVPLGRKIPALVLKGNFSRMGTRGTGFSPDNGPGGRSIGVQVVYACRLTPGKRFYPHRRIKPSFSLTENPRNAHAIAKLAWILKAGDTLFCFDRCPDSYN